MGADLVALIDPPVINSMCEFTNTSHTLPVVIKQLHLTGLLKQAQPGDRTVAPENCAGIEEQREYRRLRHVSELDGDAAISIQSATRGG